MDERDALVRRASRETVVVLAREEYSVHVTRVELPTETAEGINRIEHTRSFAPVRMFVLGGIVFPVVAVVLVMALAAAFRWPPSEVVAGILAIGGIAGIAAATARRALPQAGAKGVLDILTHR